LQEIKEGKVIEKVLQIGVCLTTDLAFNPLVRLGGEGKIIELSNLSNDDYSFKINTQDIEFEEGVFKVYLSTPAIFIDGLPNLFKKLNINATLIAACVGKPLSIGGYDMKNNRAKEMYKVVPAGSVFYFKSEDDLSLLHENQGIALSDVYAEQGFGIAYFGAYHQQE
jgi:CRISPR-associated protein Cmr3